MKIRIIEKKSDNSWQVKQGHVQAQLGFMVIVTRGSNKDYRQRYGPFRTKAQAQACAAEVQRLEPRT